MSEESIRELRLQKLARMRELGHDPYSVERFEKTADARALLQDFDFSKPEGERPVVKFAGRIVSYRLMGKAGFAHLSDGEEKIQVYFKKDDLGAVGWELFELLDIGDHLGVEGEIFTTKTGEKSIHARKLTPLSKALHVVPVGKEKEGHQWYALEDVEQRYRHRHLDLIANPQARELFLARSRIVSAARRYFESKGYVEVETPVLQTIAGGAAAKPFVTRYNAYDLDVKLRISLELYLKRLIAGDIPKVFEIGRVFRNEGVSNRHNPEFTLLEWYEAYANLEDMMAHVEGLFRAIAKEVEPTIRPGWNVSIDFSKPWKRVNLLDEIERNAKVSEEELGDIASAKKAMKRVGLPIEKEDHLGGIIEKLLEVYVEPKLIEPTFVVGYPIETSPLAKKDPKNSRMTRRFEAYVGGREVANAFSEINDPIDQRERFESQVAQKAKGDEHAHPMDEEYLYALECGMPPAGGCGIGIDRLVMVLTGADVLREVIPFPMMKPEKREETS